MILETVFELFITKEDQTAITLITQENLLNKPNLVINYLEKRIATLATFSEIEAIDLFAHYCDLTLIDKVTGSFLDDFHPHVLELVDLEHYNRCGRRQLTAVTSTNSFSFFNEQLQTTQHLSFQGASTFLSVQKREV